MGTYLQTGVYVVRAEDLPHASKLPCAQRPIKRAEFEKTCLKNISLRMGRRWGLLFQARTFDGKKIFRAQKTNFPVWTHL